MKIQQDSFKKFFAVIGLMIGVFGVGLQLFIMLQARQLPLLDSMIRFFSYFTILSNCLVILFLLGHLFPASSKFRAWVEKPEVATAVTMYIVVVGVVYQTVLRRPEPLIGNARIADDIIHGFIPLWMLVYWFLFSFGKKINQSTIPYWLIFPAVYLMYTLAHGAMIDFYPYPFVNVNELGYPKVLMNSSLLVLFFLVLAYGLAALSNRKYKLAS